MKNTWLILLASFSITLLILALRARWFSPGRGRRLPEKKYVSPGENRPDGSLDAPYGKKGGSDA